MRTLEVRYFGGMTLDEVPATLCVGWCASALARAWLATELAKLPNRGLW